MNRPQKAILLVTFGFLAFSTLFPPTASGHFPGHILFRDETWVDWHRLGFRSLLVILLTAFALVWCHRAKE